MFGWLLIYTRFMSIKLIVFATFWQDLLILLLSLTGIINWEALQRVMVENRNISLVSSGVVDGNPCVDDWGSYLCVGLNDLVRSNYTMTIAMNY